VYFMGGIVDHSSNPPDPVACLQEKPNITSVAFFHAWQQVICDCSRISLDLMSPAIPIFSDRSSAIAMGNSFRDTKHMMHVLHRYHFVWVGIAANGYKLLWIAMFGQLADIGTKQ